MSNTNNLWMRPALEVLTPSEFHFLAILHQKKDERHPVVLIGREYMLSKHGISFRSFSRLASSLQDKNFIFKIDGCKNYGPSEICLLTPIVENGVPLANPVYFEKANELHYERYNTNQAFESYCRTCSNTADLIIKFALRLYVETGYFPQDFQKYLHTSGLAKHLLQHCTSVKSMKPYDMTRLLQTSYFLVEDFTSKGECNAK